MHHREGGLFKTRCFAYARAVQFPTTNWRQLAEATISGEPAGRAALAALCADYRAPVRAFLLSRGYAPDVADDFTQEFFAELLRTRAWKRADCGRGRFRSFLCGVLRHVVDREHERQAAGKRGGGLIFECLEEGVEIADSADGAVFDREWALQLMERALAAAQAECDPAEWSVLCSYLPGAGAPPEQDEAASALGVPVSSLRTKIHRLRGRLRGHLRGLVARTVSSLGDVDGELAHLHRVLSTHGP